MLFCRQYNLTNAPLLAWLPNKWYNHAMITTIDKAGRVVIPKALRENVGLAPGEVEITVDGASLRLESRVATPLERGGKLFLPSGGASLTDEELRTLRFADQR